LVDDLFGDFTNQQYLGDNQNHTHLPSGNLKVCELEHWPFSSMIYRLLEGTVYKLRTWDKEVEWAVGGDIFLGYNRD
jgi:hypothetical protein